MASNAGTWFYTTPPQDPYLLQEQVNSTLWMARLYDVFFTAEHTDAAPYRMIAERDGAPVVLEWVPEQWLRLVTTQQMPTLAAAFSNVLQIPAVLTYMDNAGNFVTEWHHDGGEGRWREIQGNPMYQNPARRTR